MKFASSRTILAATFVAAVSIALPLQGVSAGTVALRLQGVSASAAIPHPQLLMRQTMSAHGPLTKAKVFKLAGYANQHVIVVLKNQFTRLDGRARRQLATRDAAVAAAERPVLAELRAVHATHVLAFHLIDAIKATVTPAELTHLRSEPEVRAVVPNAEIRPPRTEMLAPVTAARIRTAAAGCDSSASTPVLQPEALMLTHTAYQNPKTQQAQNLVTGKGVTVAIISGPIDRQNPDFLRPDGSQVITSYVNFTGDVPNLAGGGGGADGESFIDMSSVASQGNEVFNLNDWAHSLGKACSYIRILGMAPGASVMWEDTYGQHGSTTAEFVQAIQYAVDHGANVLSESWGGNPNNDTGIDATALADVQAVADGVTVVNSSGDAGVPNSLGSPTTSSPVLSVGATTSEQFQQLLGIQKAQHYTGYVEDNITPLSSGGITQLGNKTLDVAAPGDLNFIDCTADPIVYPGCTDYVSGQPLAFGISGGTSESAPLTAGEAALVIQAYAQTHGAAKPSPGLVKRIIMSTATDLGDPTDEQGAGIINSYKAVLAAKSWGVHKKSGDALVTGAPDITASGLPGTRESLPFTVSNDGSATEKVTPAARILATPIKRQVTTVHVKLTKANDIHCATSFNWSYSHYCPASATVSFDVPKNTDHFSVSIAWDVVHHPFGLVQVQLKDPHGRYAGTSEPQDQPPPFTQSGIGHLDITRPTPGKWTAVVLVIGFPVSFYPSAKGIPLYAGPVTVDMSASRYRTTGSFTPASESLAPGATKTFVYHTSLPAQAGDANADIVVNGKSSRGARTEAGTVPVILRALVPTSKTGGSFAGAYTGGNGRGGVIWSYTYEFKVPAGLRTLSLGVKTGGRNDNLQGVLVDPEGYPINVESTVTSFDNDPSSRTFGFPNGYVNHMQFFQVNPLAGLWRFELEVNDNLSGALISTPFTGTIAFNPNTASGSKLPDSFAMRIKRGQSVYASVRVTNTGNTSKDFFLDPRLTNSHVAYTVSGGIHLPLNQSPFDTVPQFLVPPESQGLVIGAESVATSSTATVPIQFDASNVDGTPPFGFGGDPDLLSTPGINPSNGDYTAGLTYTSNYEIPMGVWQAVPSPFGPYPRGSKETVADIGSVLLTDAFDSSVSTDTGDVWTVLLLGSTNYNPLTLGSGQSGTINVTITPNQASGSKVSGELFVDTFPATPGFPFQNFTSGITGSGDEAAAIPYAYTVK